MFKIGDEIQLKPEAKGYAGSFTHGKTYVVGGKWGGVTGERGMYVGIERSDGGHNNQWYTHEFQMVEGPW